MEKRAKTLCPIKLCRQARYDLPRHMRLIHGWPNEEAKKVKGLYGLRKTPVFKNKARRSGPVKTLPSKACPVFGCRSVIKNVSRHIRAVHKIDRRSDKYRQLLARAVTVDLYRSKTKLVSKISHLPSRRDKHYLQQLLRNDIEMGDNSSDSSFSEVSSFTANDFQSSSDISENSSLSSKNTSNSSTESLESSNDLDSSKGSENLELAFLDSNHSAFNSEVQSIFAKFFEFLVSPDSGNREHRSAKYCVKRVMRVFDVVSPDQNLNSLCDRLLLRDTFLKSYCTAQNYHPVTIQGFLVSLGHFFDFVISEDVEGFNQDKVARMKSRLPMWKSSYARARQIATMAKLELERKTKITPEDIVKFESSKVVREGIELINAYDGARKCTQKQFVLVRNLIITEIFIDNGQRAGVLSNMTYGEFANVENLGSDTFCITVFHHKEARAGPIRVILSQKLFNWLSTYVRNFRKWVTDDNRAKAKLFLTWSGKSFAYSGDISSASNSLWQKAKMKGRCGANKFRKAAVSALRDCKQTAHEEDSDLANLMGHSKATADRYYYMEQKIDSVKRAGKLLPKIMRSINVGSDRPSTSNCAGNAQPTDSSIA